MNHWKIKLSLFINYFLFAILLNSVGIIILQVQLHYGVPKPSAAILEACKDLSIAGASFIAAGYINRLGYKNAMLFALGFVSLACLSIPSLNTFWATKLLFIIVGISFAHIKVSVFVMIGLVAKDEKEHISLMSFLESFFMVGVVTCNFLFAAFMSTDNLQSATWLNVYYVLSAFAILAFLLLWITQIDESRALNQQSNASPAGGFIEMFKLLVIPLVLVFIASVFIYVLIEQSIMSWLPTFNKETLNISPKLSVQMASVLSLYIAAGRLFAGILIKKISWIVLLISCIVSAGALVLLTLPLIPEVNKTPINYLSDVPWVAFIFPLTGFFIAPIYPTLNSLILTALPSQKHGLASGLIIVFSALGGTTGSLITGNMFQKFGGTTFYFSLVPMMILIVCLIYFKKLQTKRYSVSIDSLAGNDILENDLI